jgi:hypothetical protein
MKVDHNTAKHSGRKQHTNRTYAFMDFPFVGYFSPSWAKNNLQKKKSTMLPQAKITFA